MFANYGFEDSTGIYYIRINLDLCAACTERACIKACPAGVFVAVIDDFDEESIEVSEAKRRVLPSVCAECKSTACGEKRQPCHEACKQGALTHSW